MTEKWDRRFLELAAHIAAWSKDPSTKCGAVLVRPDRTIAAVGYNGFPRMIEDDPDLLKDRKHKYARMIHAEMNALHTADRRDIIGCTLYIWPLRACDRCAAHIIQAGVHRVVSAAPSAEATERWGESWEIARLLFQEAGVLLKQIDMPMPSGTPHLKVV